MMSWRKSTKLCLLGLNALVFTALGLSLLVLGRQFLTVSLNYALPLLPSLVLFSTGGATILLGLVGFAVVLGERKLFTGLYLLVEFVAFLLLVLVAMRGRGEGAVGGVVREAMTLQLERYAINQSGEQAFVDRLQLELECCGVDNYTDWGRTPWYLNGSDLAVKYPASCCNQSNCIYGQTGVKVDSNLNTQGCYVELREKMSRSYVSALALVVSIACLLLLSLVLTFILFLSQPQRLWDDVTTYERLLSYDTPKKPVDLETAPLTKALHGVGVKPDIIRPGSKDSATVAEVHLAPENCETADSVNPAGIDSERAVTKSDAGSIGPDGLAPKPDELGAKPTWGGSMKSADGSFKSADSDCPDEEEQAQEEASSTFKQEGEDTMLEMDCPSKDSSPSKQGSDMRSDDGNNEGNFSEAKGGSPNSEDSQQKSSHEVSEGSSPSKDSFRPEDESFRPEDESFDQESASPKHAGGVHMSEGDGSGAESPIKEGQSHNTEGEGGS